MSVVECYRGTNVRVFRLDREQTVARLRERASRLVAARPDVREVWLFGSLARGEATPGSDADLAVVLGGGAGPFIDRAPDLLRFFAGVGVGCDILAYTESEIALMRSEGKAFTAAVFRDGLLLARR